jgi:hypothetical protein
MSDWNESEFWGGFVPPESWYNPDVVDLKFDHQPTKVEISSAANGKQVGSIQYPVGEPQWPSGWDQERVDKLNEFENAKVFLFLIVGFIVVLIIACPLWLVWMAG